MIRFLRRAGKPRPALLAFFSACLFAGLALIGGRDGLTKPLSAQSDTPPRVHLVPVAGVIGPATHDLIRREIRAAERKKAGLLVFALDTPGGLYDSTRQIVQDILESPVPVAVYVSPAGAQAASAGTYILYASHLAAMAPSTRLGAATPVQMSPTDASDKPAPAARDDAMTKKVVNDASAFIRSLAERHGRNAAWAESAVRAAESLTASEALSKKVVEIVTDTPERLVEKAHGRTVRMEDGTQKTLDTKGAVIVTRAPGLRHDILEIITHPNIALLLMTLGTYGLIYEFANPGALFPGILGAIFLLLGLYAVNVLPVSYSGLALIVLGIGLMTAEAFTTTFGILGIGGAAAFVFGALLLMQGDPDGFFAIDIRLILMLAALSFGVLSVALGMLVKSLRAPRQTGVEALLSQEGHVLNWAAGSGDIRIAGEIWQARTEHPHILQPGDKVIATAIDGLVLIVKPKAPPAI